MDKQKRPREYRTRENCQANNAPRRRLWLRWSLGAFLLVVGWSFLPLPQLSPEHPELRGEDLVAAVRALSFAQAPPPPWQGQEVAEARLGESLFFDQRFSANGQVSCATCHRPEQGFSDGRAQAVGLGAGKRRTPSLVNAFGSHWFFWDGRADSLAAQALGPIEHPLEHGISRTHVARLLATHYEAAYEAAFGPLPTALKEASQEATLPPEAMPAASPALTPLKIAAYTMASLDSFAALDAILVAASRAGVSPATMMASKGDMIPPTPPEWVAAWEALPESSQAAVNQVFANFGRALAAFERGIVAVDSPFDHFARRLVANRGEAREALGDGFGEQELHGFQLFVGRGQCTNCHAGPLFSDQQFHNIGLPLGEGASSHDGYVDVGRAAGLVAVRASSFNCLGTYLLGQDSESCRELPWLDLESLELVGAFKTPSLRNVAERAPYGHDGRFASLTEVLAHYNDLPADPGLGHREESLMTLDFDRKELAALEAFLKALSSPITVHSPAAISQEAASSNK